MPRSSRTSPPTPPVQSPATPPRVGTRFANPGDPFHRGDLLRVALPFFARKAWTSLVPRRGAAARVPWDPRKLRANPSLTWIGHATFHVRMEGVSLLTDPMFSTRASPVPWAGPARLVPPGVPLGELPAVDLVLISHNHYDHADLASIRALAARGARFVVPRGLGALVRDAGGEATELGWWESCRFGPLAVHCVPAQHFSGRSPFDRNRTLWAGWVLQGRTRSFLHAGDTGYFPGFAEIRRRLGPVDLAALPIGAYEPAAMMRPVHMNPEEAVQAALDLGARRAVAMHWGTFDLTDEVPDEPPRRFRRAARAAGLPPSRAWVLAIGETRRW